MQTQCINLKRQFDRDISFKGTPLLIDATDIFELDVVSAYQTAKNNIVIQNTTDRKKNRKEVYVYSDFLTQDESTLVKRILKNIGPKTSAKVTDKDNQEAAKKMIDRVKKLATDDILTSSALLKSIQKQQWDSHILWPTTNTNTDLLSTSKQMNSQIELVLTHGIKTMTFSLSATLDFSHGFDFFCSKVVDSQKSLNTNGFKVRKTGVNGDWLTDDQLLELLLNSNLSNAALDPIKNLDNWMLINTLKGIDQELMSCDTKDGFFISATHQPNLILSGKKLGFVVNDQQRLQNRLVENRILSQIIADMAWQQTHLYQTDSGILIAHDLLDDNGQAVWHWRKFQDFESLMSVYGFNEVSKQLYETCGINHSLRMDY